MKIVCDIDGVLVDPRKYIVKYLLEDSDWATYFKYTLDFSPIFPMVNLIKSLSGSRDSNIVYFLTGRPETNRRLTVMWIQKYIFSDFPNKLDKLIMRPKGNHEPTSVMKMRIIRSIQPNLIIDDDPRLVEVADREGFIVLQVHGFRLTENDHIPFKEIKNV